MTFAEKLDFLMSITKTANGVLARSVSLDASYISRLRSGKRLKPRNKSIIQGLSACLVRRVTEDYQKKALSDALKLARFPEEIGQLADELTAWLLNDTPDSVQQVSRFLSVLSGTSVPHAATLPPENCRPSFSNEAVSIYFGVEGKRQAAETFLCEVAAREIPQALLLFSDEATSWMTEDPAFMRRWAELMRRVLARGNRIKIIHTISRDLDEMLSAINQWMPLYMSGAIEPYFYPKKRDGIFKRTLFVAPETAAVISNSVVDHVCSAANILYRDRDAVTSFAEEFQQYLRLCRPLMRVFTLREQERYYTILDDFERGQADTLVKTESLSLLTMPKTLFAQILRRAGLDLAGTAAIHERRREIFLKNLRSNRFTEIISLPPFALIMSGGVKLSMSDMLGSGDVFYQQGEFVDHLQQILALLESCENYNVHLFDRPIEERYSVYAREELGVIVANTSQPPVVLAISEGNLTAAFWDFLKSLIGDTPYAAPLKAVSIAKLRAYLAKLTDYEKTAILP